jgi:hypothetical protein
VSALARAAWFAKFYGRVQAATRKQTNVEQRSACRISEKFSQSSVDPWCGVHDRATRRLHLREQSTTDRKRPQRSSRMAAAKSFADRSQPKNKANADQQQRSDLRMPNLHTQEAQTEQRR